MLDYVETFRTLRPSYEALGQRLHHLLLDIARSNHIDVHAIEMRAKSVESFAEKIARPGKSYSDPLTEVTDLCGLRVILYYQEDVERLAEAIQQELSVDGEKSINKKSELRSDQFGYISVHLICKIGANRAQLLEWRAYNGLAAEIQVRTVLQHAWASISHALKYKSNTVAPDQFTRKLSRIAGLLELSDEQFSELRKQADELRTEVARSIANHDLNVPINSVALQEFLSSSKHVQAIDEAARAAGFGTDGDNISGVQLGAVCRGLRLKSLLELDTALELFSRCALSFFQDFAKLQGKKGLAPEDIRGDNDHWCAVGVVAINHTKDVSFISVDELWSDGYFNNVLAAAKRTRI